MANQDDFTKRKLWGRVQSQLVFEEKQADRARELQREIYWCNGSPVRTHVSLANKITRSSSEDDRFSMHQYNQSLAYDKRMYAADVKGSIAFSKALQKAGIVSEHEQLEIERGLKLVEKEWEEGKVCPFRTLADISSHTLGFSSTSRLTMRISTPRTSVVFLRSSGKISAANCTQDEAGTIRSQPI
jgi:hypothetical protein